MESLTGRRPRLCLVASEVLGAHKNGGIGAATTHLALLMARSGHEVTVVYTGAYLIDYASPWIARCREAGIVLKRLDTRDGEIYPVWLRESSILHDYLRGFAFDAILFQDWEGSAFCSVVAKRAGLAFAGTALAVVAHGPTAWLLDANRIVIRNEAMLAQLHMERAAFEGADAVLCPSRHMLDWLVRSGQPFSGRATAVPLYLWSDPEGDRLRRRASPIDRVRTIAFFGRLETRKGVELFLDAILSERLAALPFRVVFVGKPASHHPAQILAAAEARRPGFGARLSFQTELDSDEAQDFLAEHDCLAVIPSLIDNAPCVISECLRRRIPFVSTATGGIPELVDPADAARVLVKPDAAALAERLAGILDGPFAPARAAQTERDVAARWTAWLGDLTAVENGAGRAASTVRRAEADDRLAVVLTHHERPKLVMQTLESLACQTRTDFDLVLVDDGSPSPAARAALDAIERRRWPFRLTVLREPNRYLGAARNAGIRATKAGRLIFMDDDNLAIPTLVETLDGAMTATGSDIVTCQLSVFRDPEDGPDPAAFAAAERWGFPAGPLELGLSLNCFGDATGLYRRTVFERVGFFHERRGVGHEDWHLHARAALSGFKITSLPVSLFWYRRVPTGMLLSTDAFANNRIIWDAYREAIPVELTRLVDLSIRNDVVGP